MNGTLREQKEASRDERSGIGDGVEVEDMNILFLPFHCLWSCSFIMSVCCACVCLCTMEGYSSRNKRILV